MVVEVTYLTWNGRSRPGNSLQLSRLSPHFQSDQFSTSLDLLVYLIANRERVVSKDDLVAIIWGGRSVSETALTTCLNAVRRAIGDSGKAQQRIRTLPRKGDRCVGDVRQHDAPEGPGRGELFEDALRPALALPDKPSIAVLTFLNPSGDQEQDYFADGWWRKLRQSSVVSAGSS
jgi:DNA-binding winged helix-turn-helix (wHTH) protein